MIEAVTNHLPAQELDVSPCAALADLSRLQEGTGD
jgi:hypothetical protein